MGDYVRTIGTTLKLSNDKSISDQISSFLVANFTHDDMKTKWQGATKKQFRATAAHGIERVNGR